MTLFVVPAAAAKTADEAHAICYADAATEPGDPVIKDFVAELVASLGDENWPIDAPIVLSTHVEFTVHHEAWELFVPELIARAHQAGLAALDPQEGELFPPGKAYGPSPATTWRAETKRKRTSMKRLAKTHVVPLFPSFVYQWPLLYEPPVEWMLRGFVFDRYSFGPRIWAGVIPLFGKTHIYLNYMSELRGVNFTFEDDEARVWTAIAQVMRTEGLERLAEILTPADFVARHPPVETDEYRDTWVDDDSVFALVASGDSQARESLILLEQKIQRHIDLADDGEGREGSARYLARVQRLRESYDDSPSAARQLLLEWRDESVTALGIQGAPID